MNLPKLLFGGILLAFGRKVFWLFTGLLGYEAGFYLLQNTYHASESISVFVGVVLGILAAVLTIFLQKVAIGVAGFLAGAYLAVGLLSLLHLEQNGFGWAIIFIGGLIGAVLLLALFDWTLIFLSSLVGAGMIASNANLSTAASAAVFLLLLVLGILFQGKVLRGK
jgi:hypothetical protein